MTEDVSKKQANALILIVVKKEMAEGTWQLRRKELHIPPDVFAEMQAASDDAVMSDRSFVLASFYALATQKGWKQIV